MRSIGLPELAILLAAVVAIIVMRSFRGKQCPACRKRIHPQATICPYCRTPQQV